MLVMTKMFCLLRVEHAEHIGLAHLALDHVGKLSHGGLRPP